MANDSRNTPGPVVLYDGDCGMCHRVVRFTLRHERDDTVRFASLDSPYARAALKAHGLDAPPAHTVVVVAGDRLLIRSEAALLLASHLHAPWRWLRIVRFAPKGLRDAIYDFVARRRHRWFPRPDTACPMPGAATKKRFLS